VERKRLVRKAEPPSKRGIRWPRWTGFRGKTVWDFLQLLIVPLMLAAIGFWFTAQQDARQQQIENQRAEAERELAVQRAQDEALQAYLNEMSSLLLEKDLRASEEESEVRTLARARTLTVLRRLEDPNRKTAIMEFLVEAELVQRIEGRGPVISLGGAELRGANLSDATLSGAVLSDANLAEVHLSNADLSGAHIDGANLSGATLRNADLSDADLSGATLSSASLYAVSLSGTTLRYADLSDADLSEASLYQADLSNADFSGADLTAASLFQVDLSDADLTGTDLTDVYLPVTELRGAILRNADLRDIRLIGRVSELEELAKTLEGATMPNGQTYEDWLKSRGEENSGSQ
jgi:uncharacterized protein YjbI with pentapeptide repeats